MKKIIIILLLVTITSFAFSKFCDGYRAGYAEGYCYGKRFCLSPLPPLCPLPGLGEYSFSDGYNRGFIEGLKNER